MKRQTKEQVEPDKPLQVYCEADCPDVEYGNCCHPDNCQKRPIVEPDKQQEEKLTIEESYTLYREALGKPSDVDYFKAIHKWNYETQGRFHYKSDIEKHKAFCLNRKKSSSAPVEPDKQEEEVKCNGNCAPVCQECYDSSRQVAEQQNKVQLSIQELVQVLDLTLKALKDVVMQLPRDETLADYNLDFAEHAEAVATGILNKFKE